MPETLRTNKGFSLIEMIVVMLIFVIVIGITGDAFNRIVSKALSLTKTAESNIAGIVGLELMRVDLEAAGYGVPWSFSQEIDYDEAADDPGVALNDHAITYPSDPSQDKIPHPLMSANNVDYGDQAVVFKGSDVLAVRGQSVATNKASKRWTYIESAVLPNTNPAPIRYDWSAENLDNDDWVVLIQPIANFKPTKQLIVNSSTKKWTDTFKNYTTIGKPPIYNDAEKKSDAYIIYGVNNDPKLSTLRMPFNRADFYVRRPAASEDGWFRLPQRCNPSTGVLIKGVVGQKSGIYDELPLLECVLDMQVVYELRTSGTSMTTDRDDISALTPKEVREQVKAIKVYILTHDGGRDKNYTYPNQKIIVGPGPGTGREYDFTANGGIPEYQNYRWRVYQIVARPSNLTGSIAQ